MKAKVLFVDDEPAILDGIRQSLRRANFDVLTSTTVNGAFEILSRVDVDVIVSDERMPGMSGHRFLSEVLKRYPKTVRMMFSGQASVSDVSKAINYGQISRYIAKPVKPKALLYFIKEAISVRELLLTEFSQTQAAVLKASNLRELEQSCPGITVVHRDADGFIVLDDAN